MADAPRSGPGVSPGSFGRKIGAQEARKIRARQETPRSIWFGFGMFGVVGWSIAVPMLLGTALGIWLDSRHPGRHSWTLMLMIAGMLAGCWNAWHWISKEHREIQAGEEKERK